MYLNFTYLSDVTEAEQVSIYRGKVCVAYTSA